MCVYVFSSSSSPLFQNNTQLRKKKNNKKNFHRHMIIHDNKTKHNHRVWNQKLLKITRSDESHFDNDMYRILEMFDDNFHIDDNRLNNNIVMRNCPKKFVRSHESVQFVEMVREYYMDQVLRSSKYRLIKKWNSKYENDRFVFISFWPMRRPTVRFEWWWWWSCPLKLTVDEVWSYFLCRCRLINRFLKEILSLITFIFNR